MGFVLCFVTNVQYLLHLQALIFRLLPPNFNFFAQGAHVIEICPLDPTDPLDTRILIGYLTRFLDPIEEWNVQWTFRFCLHGRKDKTL